MFLYLKVTFLELSEPLRKYRGLLEVPEPAALLRFKGKIKP